MFFKKKRDRRLPELELTDRDVQRGKLYYDMLSDSRKFKLIKSPLFPKRALKDREGE